MIYFKIKCKKTESMRERVKRIL